MHQSGLLIAGRYRLTATVLPDAGGVGVIADDERSEPGATVLVRHVLLPEVLSPSEPGGRHGATGIAADAATIADTVRVVAELPEHRGLGVVRDVVADGDCVWLVQERIDPGEPLSRQLACGTLDPYRAAEIAYDVLRALRHLHQLGWHHGNLTPHTIWLDDQGSAILTGLDQAVIDDLVCKIPRSMPPPAPSPAINWPGSPPRPTPAPPAPVRFTAVGGMAGGVRADAHRTSLADPRPVPSRPSPRRHEDARPPGRAPRPVRPPTIRLEAERAQDLRMITVGYVVERWAPEQANLPSQAPPFLAPVGPPADLWALGVLLFRAVTGRPPYPELGATAQLLDMVRSEPPAYAEGTGALRPLIEQLLSRDPLKRPCAGELLRWLTSILRDAPEPSATGQEPDPTPFRPRPGASLVLRFHGPLARRQRTTPPAPATAAPGPRRAVLRAARRRTRTTFILSTAAAMAAAAAVLTYTARTGTGPDHAASTSGPPPASSSGDPQPVPRPLVRDDPAGFSIAPLPSSTRHTTDRTVEFRRDGITLTVVPGHDTLRPGETMLDYQAREPELSAVRTDPASSATGLRLITVGDSPSIAEGTYRFTLGGQPTYLRNRVTTMNGALHVLVTFGPESRSEEIDTLHLQAAASYQLSPPQRQPTPLTGRNDAAGPTRGTPHASTQSEDRRGRATPARLRTDPPRTPHHPLALTGARRGSPPAPPSAPPRPDVAPTQPQETVLMATTIELDTTYAELEPGAQHVYRTLGSLPAPVADPDLVAAVCDLSLPTSGWLLEILAEERLLDPAPEGSLAARYRMNTILREHARSKAAAEPDAADQREAALRRLCDWTLKQLRHAQRLLTPAQSSLLNPRTLPDADSESPFPDEDLALAWLDDQAENLLPVLGACGDAGWDELTYQLVDAWWPFFQRRHLYELWLPAHELGVAAARRAGNEPVARQLIASWAIGISHPAAAARLRDRAASQ